MGMFAPDLKLLRLEFGPSVCFCFGIFSISRVRRDDNSLSISRVSRFKISVPALIVNSSIGDLSLCLCSLSCIISIFICLFVFRILRHAGFGYAYHPSFSNKFLIANLLEISFVGVVDQLYVGRVFVTLGEVLCVSVGGFECGVICRNVRTKKPRDLIYARLAELRGCWTPRNRIYSFLIELVELRVCF